MPVETLTAWIPNYPVALRRLFANIAGNGNATRGAAGFAKFLPGGLDGSPDTSSTS